MENAFWDGFEKEASWDKRILSSLGSMSRNFGEDAAKAKKALGELSTQGKLMAGAGAAGLAGAGAYAGRKSQKNDENRRMKALADHGQLIYKPNNPEQFAAEMSRRGLNFRKVSLELPKSKNIPLMLGAAGLAGLGSHLYFKKRPD